MDKLIASDLFCVAQNDNAAVKRAQLREQKSLTADEARRRMQLLNQSSRDTSAYTTDSDAFGGLLAFRTDRALTMPQSRTLLTQNAVLNVSQDALGLRTVFDHKCPKT